MPDMPLPPRLVETHLRATAGVLHGGHGPGRAVEPRGARPGAVRGRQTLLPPKRAAGTQRPHPALAVRPRGADRLPGPCAGAVAACAVVSFRDGEWGRGACRAVHVWATTGRLRGTHAAHRAVIPCTRQGERGVRKRAEVALHLRCTTTWIAECGMVQWFYHDGAPYTLSEALQFITSICGTQD